MSSAKQKSAARRNIKKAASAAKRKKTISHLSRSVRTALGKQGAKVAKKKRVHSNPIEAIWDIGCGSCQGVSAREYSNSRSRVLGASGSRARL